MVCGRGKYYYRLYYLWLNKHNVNVTLQIGRIKRIQHIIDRQNLTKLNCAIGSLFAYYK